MNEAMSVYGGVTYTCGPHVKYTEGAVAYLLFDVHDYFKKKHHTESIVRRNMISVAPHSSPAEGHVVFSATRTTAWILVRSPADRKADAFHLLRLLQARFAEAIGRYSSGTRAYAVESVTSSSSIRSQVKAQKHPPVLKSYRPEDVVKGMKQGHLSMLRVGPDHEADLVYELLHLDNDHLSVMSCDGRKELHATLDHITDTQHLASVLKVRGPSLESTAGHSIPSSILEEWETSGYSHTVISLLSILERYIGDCAGVHGVCSALRRELVRVSCNIFMNTSECF